MTAPDSLGRSFDATATTAANTWKFSGRSRQIRFRSRGSSSAGGCDFGSDPDVAYEGQSVFWLPEVLPSVLHIQPATPGMARWPLDPVALISPPNAIQSRGDDHVIHTPDAIHRLWSDGYSRGVMAIVLPLDLLFADRAAAAIRFWNSLIGNRPGSEPKPLTPYARGQLILAIRLLDAERDGATEREMAEYVLKERAPTRREWLATEHRSRLRRLLKKAHGLLDGGYLQILCPPPRRPRRKTK